MLLDLGGVYLELGKSEYLELLSFSPTGFTFRVYWEEMYDTLANTSKLKITSIQVKSSNWSGYSYYPDGSIRLNGKTVLTFNSVLGDAVVNVNSRNTFYTLVNSSTYTPITSELLIEHELDGTKTVSLDILGNRFSEFRFYLGSWQEDGDNGGPGWRVAGSQDIVLTHIPRASTIGATDADIEAVSMIAVGQAATVYTHSIQYKFGSLSGYITADGGVSSTEVKLTKTSIPFRVPSTFYSQIPNARSALCTLTCRTYSGNTLIGTAQTTTFRVSTSEANCTPSVSGTVVDSNATTIALTGDRFKLVRHKSVALCTIDASAKNYATLKKQSIQGVVVSGNTLSIPEPEMSEVVFAAKDSREYSNSVAVPVVIVPYIKLTNNAVAVRTDPTSGNAILALRGDYYSGSFGAVNNTLKAEYSIDGGPYINVDVSISGNTYAADVPLSSLDYQSNYTIVVKVSDRLSEAAKTVPVKRGIPVFDWGENDFAFNVPVRFTAVSYDATTKTLTIS